MLLQTQSCSYLCSKLLSALIQRKIDYSFNLESYFDQTNKNTKKNYDGPIKEFQVCFILCLWIDVRYGVEKRDLVMEKLFLKINWIFFSMKEWLEEKLDSRTRKTSKSVLFYSFTWINRYKNCIELYICNNKNVWLSKSYENQLKCGTSMWRQCQSNHWNSKKKHNNSKKSNIQGSVSCCYM